jgi:phosphatidylglycerophosphate synthase
MKIRWWKEKLKHFLMPLARNLGAVHPNWITLIAFLLSIAAAWVIVSGRKAPALHIPGAILLIMQVLADYLDGLVARTFKKESVTGLVLDRSLDRISDLLLAGALIFLVSPTFTAVLVTELILITYFIGYYSFGLKFGAWSDLYVSRTDIHLIIAIFLLFNGIRAFMDSYSIMI